MESTSVQRLQRIHLDEVDSTNNYLKQYSPEFEADITLVTANYQTAGRGQRGNSWESQQGKNVVYSLLIHPRMLKPSQFFSISEVAALSVCQALNDIHGLVTGLQQDKQAQSERQDAPGKTQDVSCAIQHALGKTQDVDLPFSIKWPNDIYYGDRKIAGILIETDLMGGHIVNAIVGVGVNVNQRVFVSDAPNPVSLYQILGREIPLQMVMDCIVQHFDALYRQLEGGDLQALHGRFMQFLYRREGYYAYRDNEGDFEARITDVELSGHLHLEDKEGKVRRYAFKEVSYVL